MKSVPPIRSPRGAGLARLLLAGYWMGLAVATHWPRLDVTGGHNNLFHGAIQADKTFHAIGFAVLTWLLMRARPAGRTASTAATAVVATIIAAAYAGIDEWTQLLFDRHVGWPDVAASLVGVFAAAVTWLSPTHAEATGPRGWRIILTRLSWVVVAPVAACLATLPGVTGIQPFQVIIGFFTGSGGLYRDKLGHFGFAWALTWLLAAAAPAGRRRPRAGAMLTILLMAAAAPVIEIIQRQTGRGFEQADIFAHELGLLVALIGWWGWTAWWSWMAADEGWRMAQGGLETPAAPAGAGRGSSSFVSHAIVVGAMTLASRMTGLVRDAVLAAVFGLGSVADAFFIGFLVPNLFRRLFGEGALSAAFIPHYTDLRQRDPEAAKRFATLCLTGLTVLLTGITLLGEAALAAMLQQPGWTEHARLALELTMVMLPYMPLICVVALIGGVLQVHGKFGAPAAAPVLLNLAMIGGAAWVLWNPTTPPEVAPGVGMGAGADGTSASLRATAFVIAWSVVVAGVLQLAWQVAAMLRVTRLSAGRAGTVEAMRGMLRMMLPMVIGLAVFQINAFLDSLIAFLLAAREGGPARFDLLGWYISFPMDAGAVAALQWSQRLYQFPLGVFGIAVATAIFPALAAAAPPPESPEAPEASREDRVNPQAADIAEAFARILRQGLRLTVFIGLPASVGLVLLRLPLSRVVYERGEFGLEDSYRVASILAGYSTSIWAYSMTHVLTRGFYALKDSTTPLKVSVGMVGFNLALNLTLIWPLGAAGLAWATAISAVGQVVLLIALLGRRVPRLVDGYVLLGWGRSAALSAVMAAALLPLTFTFDLASPSFTYTALTLLGLVLLGMAIVFVGAWLTGAEELAWLRRPRPRMRPGPPGRPR